MAASGEPLNTRDTWLLARHGAAKAKLVAEEYQKFREGCPLVLQDLALFCGALGTSVVPGDPYLTHVNEGKRMVFLHICDLMQVDPSILENLIEEIEND